MLDRVMIAYVVRPVIITGSHSPGQCHSPGQSVCVVLSGHRESPHVYANVDVAKAPTPSLIPGVLV